MSFGLKTDIECPFQKGISVLHELQRTEQEAECMQPRRLFDWLNLKSNKDCVIWIRFRISGYFPNKRISVFYELQRAGKGAGSMQLGRLMDAIYYDTQSYTTEDVRTRRGVCVRKATKDDDICLSSFLLVYLVFTES